MKDLDRKYIFVPMKNVFFLLLIAGFTIYSCRNEDDVVQDIDQIVQIYIDSAGQDMLNTNIKGGYTDIRMNDVNGFTDTAPVSFILKKDSDTLNYIEYVAGARRIGIDSVGTSKTYESTVALIFNKRTSDSTTVSVNDTIRLQYNSTPELFQISKVWYNKVLKFTKEEGTTNVVKVQK